MINEIWVVSDKKEEKFLRKKTAEFNFKEFTKRDIQELISNMKRIMRKANGIGLSANQIGLNYKVFVAEVPDAQGAMKFYAIFNPKIDKTGDEALLLEEGCLSIPRKYGHVERWERIVLSGMDRHGKAMKIKAWGLLAHVFQHETDHLNGVLYTDKAKDVYEAPSTPRLQEREKKIK